MNALFSELTEQLPRVSVIVIFAIMRFTNFDVGFNYA